MKKAILTFAFLLSMIVLHSQSLIGAWETTVKDENGITFKHTVIITEKYQVATWYDAETGVFHSSNGGSWSLKGNTLTEIVEFDTEYPDRVGTKAVFELEIRDNSFNLVGDKMT